MESNWRSTIYEALQACEQYPEIFDRHTICGLYEACQFVIWRRTFGVPEDDPGDFFYSMNYASSKFNELEFGHLYNEAKKCVHCYFVDCGFRLPWLDR